MRAEDPWVNIDQEIRRTVCSNNLVYPALGLAGMSLSKKKKRKKMRLYAGAVVAAHHVESARRKRHMKGCFFSSFLSTAENE